ncbi:Predicted methyltransferase [Ceraceosorus bombacis]|uniref:Predicted methyltransferase n=1 Tax=Ceraceosorus bombacis TaxID=401625 RepID=A0A0N7L8V8_9BASI|nr:Predicted methyltransferase [Ceraceosorus bombacis]
MTDASNVAASSRSRADSRSSRGSTDLSLFAEPSDFRPATPPPTMAHFTLPAAPSAATTMSEDIELKLVGSHPLWGHHLWNAAPVLSRYLNAHADSLLRNTDVLELGAAAGLPSIVCKRRGARTVVATDWPDNELMANLESNCKPHGCVSQGFVWGADPSIVTQHLPSEGDTKTERFSLLLLSDLVFNHQAHPALLKTLSETLNQTPSAPSVPRADDVHAQETSRFEDASAEQLADVGCSICPQLPCALVFFSHHRPQFALKDMQFFESARGQGWVAEEVGRWRMPPMFKDDPGDEAIRGTVHGWRLFKPAAS